MGNASRDDNFVTTLTGVSNADNITPVAILADPATGRLLVNVSGSFASQNEDDAHNSGDQGVMFLAVRNDTAGTLSSDDGDYTPLQVDSSGYLRVVQSQYSEDAATPATIAGQAVMMERDDALTTVTPIEGDWIGLRGTAEGALWVQDFNSDAILADTTAILAVTASMDTNLATVAGAVTGTEMQVDVVGALPAGTNAIGKLAANSGVDIGDVDVTSITGLTMSNDAAQTTGDEAHDAVDAGNPVKIGGRAQEPTAALEEVADNDRVDAAFDRQGRLAVWMGYPVVSADINDASSGDNTIVAAQGSGTRIAVLGFSIISDGTVDARWEDGAGGTAKTGQYPFQAREGISRNGGMHPIFVCSDNTLLNLELSGAVNVHGEVSYVVMTD